MSRSKDPVVLAAARATLNKARAGEPIPEWAITLALVETGDLEYGEVPVMRATRAPGSWERGECGLLRPASWVDVVAS